MRSFNVGTNSGVQLIVQANGYTKGGNDWVAFYEIVDAKTKVVFDIPTASVAYILETEPAVADQTERLTGNEILLRQSYSDQGWNDALARVYDELNHQITSGEARELARVLSGLKKGVTDE